jgi:transcriptional regulator with XRE-family HTH domain
MTERLIRSSADMVALFAARAKDLGLSHREVDERAGLGDGHFSQVMCGDRNPGALTIERICGALQLAFVPIVLGAARSCVGENSERGENPQIERKHDEQGPLNSGPRAGGTSREIGG